MKEKCTVLNEKRAVQDEKALSLDSIRNGELSNHTQKEEKSEDSNPLKSDKGAMLMKLMGWKGGGIGKKENGRTEIVGVSFHLFHLKTIIIFFSNPINMIFGPFNLNLNLK